MVTLVFERSTANEGIASVGNKGQSQGGFDNSLIRAG